MANGGPVNERGLTGKQQAFVDAYLQRWNATQAARDAGYSGDDDTLRSVGAENLAKPSIAAAVQARISARVMQADELLSRLADQARGSLAPFLAADGETIDVTSEAAKQNIGIIKKYRTKHGTTKSGEPWVEREIELYSAKDALELIGRHLALFLDKQQSGLDEETRQLLRDLNSKS